MRLLFKWYFHSFFKVKGRQTLLCNAFPFRVLKHTPTRLTIYSAFAVLSLNNVHLRHLFFVNDCLMDRYWGFLNWCIVCIVEALWGLTHNFPSFSIAWEYTCFLCYGREEIVTWARPAPALTYIIIALIRQKLRMGVIQSPIFGKGVFIKILCEGVAHLRYTLICKGINLEWIFRRCRLVGAVVTRHLAWRWYTQNSCGHSSIRVIWDSRYKSLLLFQY